jgi:type II secretory pathway predicted ATPase ExeA
MYQEFFGFNDRPFSPTPLAKRYFAAASAEAARQTLARCIDRCEGISLLIGPAGTGKTLLCQVLADQFRARFAIALLASGRIATPRNLFQAILFELGLPYRGMEDGELRLALLAHLTSTETHQAGLLLLIDESHLLPLRILEEVRLLTNLLRNGQPRVRLLLSGGPALEERIASPKLESFNQRIAARCYLQAFDHDQTLGYVGAELSGVGVEVEQIFTGDALDAIHRATDGIPRLINQLCDHALVLAFAGGVRQIGQPGIEEAWADLQQLPTPWTAATETADRSPDIIEFGALDEDVLPITASAERVTAPRLHAVIDEDEAALFFGEPADRIEKIEATIDAIEGDYEPAATKAPEIELVFTDPDDPFAEDFAEEELVVDRFAELESGVLANRPLVRSAEGRELSTLLEQHRDHSTHDRADLSPNEATDSPAPESDGDEALAAWNTPDGLEPDEFESDVSSESVALSDDSAEAGRTHAPFRPDTDPVLPDEFRSYEPADDPSEVEMGESRETRFDEDHDLIIVEDDPPDPVPPGPPPPKVRRQKYRHLFARLRRG